VVDQFGAAGEGFADVDFEGAVGVDLVQDAPHLFLIEHVGEAVAGNEAFRGGGVCRAHEQMAAVPDLEGRLVVVGADEAFAEDAVEHFFRRLVLVVEFVPGEVEQHFGDLLQPIVVECVDFAPRIPEDDGGEHTPGEGEHAQHQDDQASPQRDHPRSLGKR